MRLDKRHCNAIGAWVLTLVVFVSRFTEHLEMAFLLLGKYIGEQVLVSICEVVIVRKGETLLFIMRCILVE